MFAFKANAISGGNSINTIVLLDERFTNKQQKAIKSGINKWVYSSRGMISLSTTTISLANILNHLTDSGCVGVTAVIPLASSSNTIKSYDKQIKKYTLGLTYYNKCSLSFMFLVVDRLTDSRDLQVVSTHEFGHAIGLALDKHPDDVHAIMHGTYNHSTTSDCLTKIDMKLFCNKYDCDVKEMLYCKTD